MLYIAKTFFGLEPLLADELRQLGVSGVTILNRAVSFEGDQKTMYEANLWLRTALRVLQPIRSFPVFDENALYEGVRSIAWREYLKPTDTLAVDSLVHSPHFTNSHYVALKTKDAIVDQIRDESGARPSIDLDNPTYRIHVRIDNDECQIALDTSGESLYKRGYRVQTNAAPLNEVVASALVLFSGWNGSSPLMDPMCGSGTILTEAATIALNRAPGLKRKRFGFFSWKDFDREGWDRIVTEARAKEREVPVSIHGSDIDPETVKTAQRNVESANLGRLIKIQAAPFDALRTAEKPGTIIMNPPYGERLTVNDARVFYKAIGDTLKKQFTGWDAWILSGNLDALKHLGLHPSKKIPLYNGAIECRFHRYALYAGSVKAKYRMQ